MPSYRRKLIETAIPLDAINRESAREKSIRHGHPSTLHLWWARRPLAACRAVIFCSLIDDPGEEGAPVELLAQIDALPAPNPLPADWGALDEAEQRRRRLFRFIETLVKWESTTDEQVIGTVRELILAATEGNPPPLLDPFCGGGSIPLEAQRLGLEAYGSDLNPVAVLITKALIELPPKFAGMPPVNPDARGELGADADWQGAAGLAADVRWYGEWMREQAWKRIGHLYPKGPNGETVIAWIWARTVQCPESGLWSGDAVGTVISALEEAQAAGLGASGHRGQVGTVRGTERWSTSAGWYGQPPGRSLHSLRNGCAVPLDSRAGAAGRAGRAVDGRGGRR